MTSTPISGKILLVDDDEYITDLLKFNLESEGFGVDVEKDARKVSFDILNDYRMLIVDAMRQDYTGLDLCNDIKTNSSTANVPVLLCTSREDEDLIIEAFDNGAEDFMSKPFSLRELIARVKAILRRHPMAAPSDKPTRRIELVEPEIALIIEVETQKVVSQGKIIPLTKTEFSILVFLMKNKNSFFTREEIRDEVWKDEQPGNNRIVDTNISRLRKKLGDNGRYVINRYGLGYAFVDNLL